MKINLSDSLRRHLVKERENGFPMAVLLAQIFLFAASLCVKETTFISNQEAGQIKVAMSYHIASSLLPFSKLLSGNKFLRKDWGSKVPFFSTCTCLLLAVIFESFYEKSLAILGVVLCMAVLVLLLLVIIRPRNNLGLVGFFIGMAGSISSRLYKLGYQTWVVVAICFVLVGFTVWLDKNWLEVEVEVTEEDQTNTTLGMSKLIVKVLFVSEALVLAVFFLYWDRRYFVIDYGRGFSMSQLDFDIDYGRGFSMSLLRLAVLNLWFTRATLCLLNLGPIRGCRSAR